MGQVFKNGARTELDAGISASTNQFTVIDGTIFPVANASVTGGSINQTSGDWFKLVLQDDSGNFEIVYCYGHEDMTHTFTVLRGQEDTTARDFVVGTTVGLRLLSSDLDNIHSTLTLLADSKQEKTVPAAKADALTTARTITLSGAIQANATWDASGDLELVTNNIDVSKANGGTLAVGRGGTGTTTATGSGSVVLDTSPAFVGTPTAPTATSGTNTTQLANTAFVTTAVSNALAAKLDANDPSVTNAREWTASEISQAEAEAGTATTARKWTAQRVRQAITGWWATVGTTFGKALLASSNANEARTNLGLGTAATANVTTSSIDATDGRLMKVGDFGLGVPADSAYSVAGITDLDNPNQVSGIFRVASGTAGTFPPGVLQGIVRIERYNSSSEFIQFFTATRPESNRGKVYVRAYASGFHSWVEQARTGSPIFTGTPSVPNLKFGNVASNDVNTLDYYEEGTFVPTFYGLTTAGAPTYVTNVGDYTRIGDTVFWTVFVRFSAIGGMEGALRIGGIPFVILNSATGIGAASIGFYTNLSGTSTTEILANHDPGSSSIRLYKRESSSTGCADLLAADIGATFRIYLSGNYKVA